MRQLVRAFWYRREACAWLMLFGTIVTLQIRDQGVIPLGPPPQMGDALIPSWPPTSIRSPPTPTLTSTSIPPTSTTVGGQPTTTTEGTPGRGTGPEVPPGLAPPTTTTLPAATSSSTTATTVLVTTTTKLCNRPGQPSQATLPSGKPVDSRQVDHRVVCSPTK